MHENIAFSQRKTNADFFFFYSYLYNHNKIVSIKSIFHESNFIVNSETK
jgi:hypothetical protein